MIRLKFCTISWASVHKSGPSEARGERGGGTQLHFEIKVEVLTFEIIDEYLKNCQNWFKYEGFCPKIDNVLHKIVQFWTEYMTKLVKNCKLVTKDKSLDFVQ